MLRYHLLHHDTTPDWRPLRQLTELTGLHPALPPLHIDDFVHGGRLAGFGVADLHRFLHCPSGQWLNLDTTGTAYRHVTPLSWRSTDQHLGAYERHHSLAAALLPLDQAPAAPAELAVLHPTSHLPHLPPAA